MSNPQKVFKEIFGKVSSQLDRKIEQLLKKHIKDEYACAAITCALISTALILQRNLMGFDKEKSFNSIEVAYQAIERAAKSNEVRH